MAAIDTWNSLCTPAQLYAVLSLISIVLMAWQRQMNGVIAQALFAVVWTLVLGWICTKGWTGLSWFLVLLPIILSVLAVLALGTAVLAVGDAVKETAKDVKQDVQQATAVAQGQQQVVSEHFYY